MVNIMIGNSYTDNGLQAQAERIKGLLNQAAQPQQPNFNDVADAFLTAMSAPQGQMTAAYSKQIEAPQIKRQNDLNRQIESQSAVYDMMQKAIESGDRDAKAVNDAIMAYSNGDPAKYSKIWDELNNDKESVNALNANTKVALAANKFGFKDETKDLERRYKEAQIGALDMESQAKLADAQRKASGLLDTDKQVELEQKFRKEFNDDNQNFKTATSAYQKIIDVANRKKGEVSAASDVALIFGFMKLQDPTSTVREGEYATAENARGIPQSIIGMYNKAVDGEFLSPKQRKDFVDAAGKSYQNYLDSYKLSRKQYEDIAEGSGLRKEYAVPELNQIKRKDSKAKNNQPVIQQGKKLLINEADPKVQKLRDLGATDDEIREYFNGTQ